MNRIYRNTGFGSLIVILSILLVSCGSGKNLNSNLQKEFSSAIWSSGFTGLYVTDAKTNREIFSYNAEKHFIPASNIKLYTFYAALRNLPDSITGLYYQVRNDSIFIKGAGDPTFLNSEFSSQSALEFLKNRKEPIAYVLSNKEISKQGAGWAWDDYSYYYSAEKTDFPIYGNSISLIKNDQLQVVPRIFDDSVSTTELNNIFARDLHSNKFRVSLETGDTLKIPFRTSAELFTQLLSDTLHKPVAISQQKFASSSWKVVKSQIAFDVYKVMLQKSDNFLAEQLLLQISQKLTDTLEAEDIYNSIQSKDFSFLPHKMRWVDGSGLSRYNLTTPKNNVFLLSKINQIISLDSLKNALPAGGQQGTLKKMFISEKPYVFAKSGSLSNNYSLTGIIHTRKGNDLYFSFMNNNYTIPTSEIKQEIEKIIYKIYQNY